jgi:hypothetical protein
MSGSETCPRCAVALAPEDALCPRCGADAAPAPAAAVALPPRYEVKVELGRGGMGRVFLCRDRELDAEVAVKVLPPEVAGSPKHLARIEAEAKVAAHLRGLPGILSLYGFERHGETCLLVMEYAAGGSIFDRLAGQKRIPETGCRRVGAEVAEALARAHGRGVLHRDIKPGNILIDIHGAVRVADFGLARVVEGAYAGPTAVPLEGTPVYMPPEVLRGEGADGRSDLYSLGAMLWEMATGEPPYRGSAREIRIAKIAPGHQPPDPRAVLPSLSPEFSGIVLRLMATDPRSRFPGAAAVAEALRGSEAAAAPGPSAEAVPVLAPRLPAPATASSRAPPPAPPPASRRSPLLLVGAALAVAGLAVVAALASRKGEGDASPPAEAGTGAASPAAPAPERPVLVVITKPPGATILVDGVPAGRTEGEAGLTLRQVGLGVPHTVSAVLEDHESDEQRGVILEQGREAAPVVLRLVPKSGLLSLEGGPPGALVTLRREGRVVRQTQLRDDGTLAPEILEAGLYEVEVEAPGFRPWKQPVRVSSARAPAIRLSLVEEEGTLSVATIPPGATVLRDGTPLGTTPLLAVPVPPGKCTLVIEHPEAAAIVREVVFRGGKATELGVLPLPAPALLDLSGLPAGVTAEFGGNRVEGILRRPPGRILMIFRREGSRPRQLELHLREGPNALPALDPWEPLPVQVDFSALGSGAIAVHSGATVIRPPWKPAALRPGVVHLLVAREDGSLVPLRLSVPAGGEVRVPALPAPAPARGTRSAVAEAVTAGVDWLARHQGGDGSWEPEAFDARCRGERCAGGGYGYHRPGVTALAVLAILGGRGVEGARWDGTAAWRGLRWLLENRDEKGTFGGRASDHFTYAHALGTLAMLEGWRAFRDPDLLEAARKGVEVIVACRSPSLGWRYGERPKDSDTSVTCWMAKALGEAMEEGLPVETEAIRGALAWFDQVTDPEWGRAGYTARGNGPARPQEHMDRFPADRSESLTAAALAARFGLGEAPTDLVLSKGVDLCMKILPKWAPAEGRIDYYYWYLGTQALHRVGGSRWTTWQEALEQALLPNQARDRRECRFGSWDAADPWKDVGGRVYSTAMNLLALEVPGRASAASRHPAEPTTLSVSSDPPGSLVLLDGAALGCTPLSAVPVPAGPAVLRVVHPSRADHEKRIEIAAFVPNDLGRIALPAADAFVDLGDLPRDAAAFLDGREAKGRVPAGPGPHRLLVLRAGHFSQSLQVEAAPGSTEKPVLGPWRAVPELATAVVKGLPAPPAPSLEGLDLPEGAKSLGGRLLWSRDRAEMVLVPALERAGRPPARAFLLDRHEVSVAQYEAYCKEAGKRMPPLPAHATSRHPVVGLEWRDAEAYARWAGKRLPTLEEWERGAYGAPRTGPACAGPWPWGPHDSPRARNLEGREDGQPSLSFVGVFPQGMSPCGALETVGNAAEWVAEGRLVGGSHATDPDGCGPRFVLRSDAAAGFRCAADFPPAGK